MYKQDEFSENSHCRLRKKIWEISDGYHCSIIGACLRRSELRKLARKKSFDLKHGLSDYEIHSDLVSRVVTRNPRSRALQKLLEVKYRAAVNRYAGAKDDAAIKGFWREDMQNGAVAGAYWAVMTHPRVSGEVRSFVYGQVHMLGFDFFGEYQRDRKGREELRNKAMVLEEVLGSERELYLREKAGLENEIAELKAMRDETGLTAGEESGCRYMMTEVAGSSVAQELEALTQELAAVNRDNSELREAIGRLSGELKKTRDMLRLTENGMLALEEEKEKLAGEKEELQQEISAVETVMLMQAAPASECAGCNDKNTGRCPGPDLCGKMVLYVGGLHNMVPRYREVVEKHGGRFMHHDGGKESSRSLLPKMLTSSDAVLCPVDCVSHDACLCVKKMCKRYQKPFVMMRSAGISSLVRGLNDIVQ